MSNHQELAGQTAVVTGAARGLGEAFARRLAAEGCNVVVTDRLETVGNVAADIGAISHVGDVADATHVRSVIDATLDTHGRIDILVNNAGEVWPTGPRDSWETATDDFDRLVGSNLKGHFLFGRAAGAAMDQGGNIVHISTDHVMPGPGLDRFHGHGSMDLYNAAKWAINGLTLDWARSLARQGVRVNSLCMGATDTTMLREWLGGDPDPGVVATWMQPAQVAQVLVDLLNEGPEGRTGDNIGLYIGQPCVLPPPG